MMSKNEKFKSIENEFFTKNFSKMKISLLWKGTFKRFLFIPKSTSSEVIYQMIGIDFVDLVRKNKEETLLKWDQRKRGIPINSNGSHKVLRLNPLIGISNKFCQIMKIEGNVCLSCRKKGIKTIINQKHLEEVHEIKIFGYQRLWEEIRDYFIQKKKEILGKPFKKLKREAFQKKWDGLMQEILEDTKKKLEEIGQQEFM